MQFSAIYRSESKGKYIDILYIDILGKEMREFFKKFLAKPGGTAGKNQIDFLLIRMLEVWVKIKTISHCKYKWSTVLIIGLMSAIVEQDRHQQHNDI